MAGSTTEPVVNEMTSQCFDVIGRRAVVLRILRENVNDRKVMICAYAFLNMNSHVMMLDCWRRWTLWWKGRRRWKLALWNYRYVYHSSKMVAIFAAWKQFTPSPQVIVTSGRAGFPPATTRMCGLF